MDQAASIIEAASSPWGIVALLVLGFFALMWKFGNQLIELLKQNREVGERLETAIKTNHGSKNLGDAVDRLTTWAMAAEDRATEDRKVMTALGSTFAQHLKDSEPLFQLVRDIRDERERARSNLDSIEGGRRAYDRPGL